MAPQRSSTSGALACWTTPSGQATCRLPGPLAVAPVTPIASVTRGSRSPSRPCKTTGWPTGWANGAQSLARVGAIAALSAFDEFRDPRSDATSFESGGSHRSIVESSGAGYRQLDHAPPWSGKLQARMAAMRRSRSVFGGSRLWRA